MDIRKDHHYVLTLKDGSHFNVEVVNLDDIGVSLLTEFGEHVSVQWEEIYARAIVLESIEPMIELKKAA